MKCQQNSTYFKLDPTLVGGGGGGYCDLDPTSVGEGNEEFLIRVWKPLPSRHALKP